MTNENKSDKLFVVIISEILYRYDYEKKDYIPFDVDCHREYVRKENWQLAWDYFVDVCESFNRRERHSNLKKQLGFLERHVLDVYRL